MSWFGIAVTYIRFYAGLKAQGIDRNKLPYKSPFQPYAAWYGATACLLINFVRLCILLRSCRYLQLSLQFSGWAVFLKGKWATDTFVTNYLPLALFPILYIGAWLWTRQGFIRPEDMDFKTGLEEVEAASYDEPPPRNWVEKVWSWLVRTTIHTSRCSYSVTHWCCRTSRITDVIRALFVYFYHFSIRHGQILASTFPIRISYCNVDLLSPPFSKEA